jgi:hypothetical protein
MHSTAKINAIVTEAKNQRADYIASKLQGGFLPVALAALVSLVVVSLVSEPSQDQAQSNPVVEISANNG